jgi:glycosyltransferase involved in cell wall biosynthesis
VFSSSRCSRNWCAERYGLDPDRVPVLHTGIDTSVFRPAARTSTAHPTIIFVGKLASNKGIALLVDVACLLAAEFPELRLQILGRGSDEIVEQLRGRAQNAGFPELLDFRGFVERHELPRYLSQADVLAVPSDYEGGPGFVYLEAMACGVPVVACRGSGADEAITDGVTGLLVPPRDREALLSVLQLLLRDRNRREEMGMHAAEYVRREADSERCLKRIAAFYGDVVRRHQERRLRPAPGSEIPIQGVRCLDRTSVDAAKETS